MMHDGERPEGRRQPAAVRARFGAAHGEAAGAHWAAEHDAELACAGT